MWPLEKGLVAPVTIKSSKQMAQHTKFLTEILEAFESYSWSRYPRDHLDCVILTASRNLAHELASTCGDFYGISLPVKNREEFNEWISLQKNPIFFAAESVFIDLTCGCDDMTGVNIDDLENIDALCDIACTTRRKRIVVLLPLLSSPRIEGLMYKLNETKKGDYYHVSIK